MRLAMWSGPRNLSTALMYSFGARSDCAVIDEPFYAAWLAASGAAHPMRDEILRSQPTDPREVVRRITGPIPGGKRIWYQKHMVHHLLPGFPLAWVERMRHVFLIRHPARVLASYLARHERPGSVEELGFGVQRRLLERIHALTGRRPLVVDATDIRAAPGPMLERLCGALGIPFEPAMLHWPAGGRAEDGVWAAHWYGAVHRSTGFAGPEGPLPEVPEAWRAALAPAIEDWRALHAERLRAPGA
ncbi:MAG: HAD family hydrolase [Alphaproteobacteria bacterium]|nr:MAG: HAD family hydrolase [Alphaproteobacteria bacterium]